MEIQQRKYCGRIDLRRRTAAYRLRGSLVHAIILTLPAFSVVSTLLIFVTYGPCFATFVDDANEIEARSTLALNLAVGNTSQQPDHNGKDTVQLAAQHLFE